MSVYAIGQKVKIAAHNGEVVRVVNGVYRVETWEFYTLSGLDGYMVRVEQLTPLEPKTAPGFVPSPMREWCERERRST